MVNCTFCYASYEMTDTQSIKSMRVRTTVMLDYKQVKVKPLLSMHNQLICKDITTEVSLISSIKVGVAHNYQ